MSDQHVLNALRNSGQGYRPTWDPHQTGFTIYPQQEPATPQGTHFGIPERVRRPYWSPPDTTTSQAATQNSTPTRPRPFSYSHPPRPPPERQTPSTPTASTFAQQTPPSRKRGRVNGKPLKAEWRRSYPDRARHENIESLSNIGRSGSIDMGVVFNELGQEFVTSMSGDAEQRAELQVDQEDPKGQHTDWYIRFYQEETRGTASCFVVSGVRSTASPRSCARSCRQNKRMGLGEGSGLAETGLRPTSAVTTSSGGPGLQRRRANRDGGPGGAAGFRNTYNTRAENVHLHS